MNVLTRWYNTVKINWSEAFSDDRFKKLFWWNFVISFLVFFSVIHWLQYNSTRHGARIWDPIYPYLTPRDLSVPIFILTYSSAVLLILYMIQYPRLIHRAFSAFVIMFVLRGICIYLVPLSPSPDLILLRDPYTSVVAGEDHIYNDLFFSGHVADLALFFFLCRNIWLKGFFGVCTILVALFLVWQRIHYTLDVVAAPVFAYLSYWVFVEKDFMWSPFLKRPAFE